MQRQLISLPIGPWLILVSLSGLDAWAGNGYDQHVVFDNGPPISSYSHSLGTVVRPSTLEIEGSRWPITTSPVRSAPNALRLRWTSAPGGDWRMTLRTIQRYGHRIDFQGSAITFWCFSLEGLDALAAPRVGVQDSNGANLPDIPLLTNGERLVAKQWTRIVIPFESFRGPFRGTEDPRFDQRKLASISFVQGLDDGKEHTLLLDDFLVTDPGAVDRTPPAPPQGLIVTGRDSHFDLAWGPNHESDLLGYRLYRSADGQQFEPVAARSSRFCRAVDHVGRRDQTMHYQVAAVDVQGNESQRSPSQSSSTRAMNDDQLLEMVQESCFRYYWDGANRPSGMAVEIVPGDEDLVALGASGFGIMAMVAATERGFVPREAAVERMLQIVRFLRKADRFHGVWPHFLHGHTGKVWPYFGKYDNGGDLVETAFLMQGLLTARQYFDHDTPQEREVHDTITTLWHEVEWNWYRKSPDSDCLYWHWSPDYQWHIRHPLVGWNETLIVYLLAIASPTHPVPAALYHSGWAGQSPLAIQYRRNWSRTTDGDRFTNGNSYYGHRLEVGEGTGGELFFTQFSFLGFDPRGKRDAYTNYFRNNQAITRINRDYCRTNPRGFRGYSANCWGRSAGVNSGGGRALPRDDNGTICCSAALGCFPYTPRDSMACLKHFYRELGPLVYGAYGFHDGFNQTEAWYDEVYMGLNQAQIVVMIENHRSGLVWDLFMANAEIQPALEAIGFREDAISP